MVQIQPPKNLNTTSNKSCLNPTWFRYNSFFAQFISEYFLFKSHMVQIQHCFCQLRRRKGGMFKSHMVQIQRTKLYFCIQRKELFKSHMVQIQLILNEKVIYFLPCLNPTWFRYNKKVRWLPFHQPYV